MLLIDKLLGNNGIRSKIRVAGDSLNRTIGNRKVVVTVGEDRAEGEEKIPMLESNVPTIIR